MNSARNCAVMAVVEVEMPAMNRTWEEEEKDQDRQTIVNFERPCHTLSFARSSTSCLRRRRRRNLHIWQPQRPLGRSSRAFLLHSLCILVRGSVAKSTEEHQRRTNWFHFVYAPLLLPYSSSCADDNGPSLIGELCHYTIMPLDADAAEEAVVVVRMWLMLNRTDKQNTEDMERK